MLGLGVDGEREGERALGTDGERGLGLHGWGAIARTDAK